MVRVIGAKDIFLVKKHFLRGDTFRKFSRLRELGSLVSQSVRIIALTTTATAATRVAAIRSLGLDNPLVISRERQYFLVCDRFQVNDSSSAIAAEIKRCGAGADRTIIFLPSNLRLLGNLSLFSERARQIFPELSQRFRAEQVSRRGSVS